MIIERIKTIIDYKDISTRQFCIKVGIANGFFDKVKDVGTEKLLKILNAFPEINPLWLLMGEGSMLKNDTLNSTSDVITADKAAKGIPLVDAQVLGGFGRGKFSIKAQDVKEYYVIPKFKDCKIDFMIEVSGESMCPKYASGDVVACTVLRESRFIQWGKAYVIGTVEQGLLIKRIYPCIENDCFECRSDNEKYPPFEVHKKEITGLALVAGVIRLE